MPSVRDVHDGLRGSLTFKGRVGNVTINVHDDRSPVMCIYPI